MYEDLVAFAVFAPAAVAPVTLFAVRNASGVGGGAAPNKVAVGHYQIFTPTHLDPKRVHISARGDGPPAPNFVQLGFTDVAGGTNIDIFVFDLAGAPTDAVDRVEVVIKRLPVGPA